MNLQKLIICLFLYLSVSNVSGQDIVDYKVTSEYNVPDTLNNYSVSNFTSFDMLIYIELKQQDIFTKLHPHFIDSSLIAFKNKSLTKRYTYKDLRSDLMTSKDTVLEYDTVTNTFTKYINYPSNIYYSRGMILNLPISIGFILLSKKTIYLRFTDIQKYLSHEEVTLLYYLHHKELKVSNTRTIIPFAKEEVHALALNLYDAGIKGKARMYWNYYDTATYTPLSLKERVDSYWFENVPDTVGNKGKSKKRKVVVEFNADSVKYLRLYSRWQKTNLFSCNVDIAFLAPTFKPIITGIHLPNTSIFLLKANEVFPYLTKEEIDFYSYCFRFNLSNRMSNKNLQLETEYSRKYPPDGYEAE